MMAVHSSAIDMRQYDYEQLLLFPMAWYIRKKELLFSGKTVYQYQFIPLLPIMRI
ncbi:MAG: hypothetical protein IPL27_22665 [Lewinellaceae bacterium]|nr:hypothetical protein [Lewinellaceae bacterium]